MELFEKLGIDWRLLIAQIVNFLILMGALFFLLYKPLLSALEKRRVKIAESLENAERIGAELKRTNAETSRLVGEARAEAQRIITDALTQAEALRTATVEKAKTEVTTIVKESKQQIAADREQLIRDVRAAAADLIAAATEKVTGEKMNSAKDKALVEKVLETV
jgi:F-type H+-transporting ATPase subunit b